MTRDEAILKSEKFIKAFERRQAAKKEVNDGDQTPRERKIAKQALRDAATLLADLFVNEE